MRKTVITCIMAITTIASSAQAVTKDQDVIAACTSPTPSVYVNCERLVVAYIAGLRAADGNVDSALGALAFALVTNTNFGPTTKEVIYIALKTIIASISDEVLKVNLQAVADDVRDDGRLRVSPTKPYSPMSPSGN